jgi:excisionase family DNA binding protein
MTITGIRNGCQPAVVLPGLIDLSPQPPELVRHLAVALSRHVRDLRQAGRVVPAEVDELATFLAHAVRTRPHATPVDDGSDPGHSPGVEDRLLVTKGEAAGRLGVSVRTIERLVAAGRLPLVHVERAARFRVADLEAFVHDLSEEQAPECDTASPRHAERPDRARGRCRDAAELARQVTTQEPWQSNTTAGGCGDSSPHRREVF